MLKKQVFAQSMMENLINDLMDHAKHENDKFIFVNEYFNLIDTIYEAVQMVLFTA